MNKHVTIHTDEKQFVCTICDKTFSARSSLNLHIKLHNDEKPFACVQCEKRFFYEAIFGITYETSLRRKTICVHGMRENVCKETIFE